MANTRFIDTNYLIPGSIATVKNGTGGGAPARAEDPNQPMENALDNDRYTPWVVPSPSPNPLIYDLDLGANRLIAALGIHGMIFAQEGIGFPSQCTISYGTAAGGYGTWVPFNPGSIFLTGGPRDAIAILASSVVARYVRFQFESTSGNAFAVGKFLVTNSVRDLGITHSAGATWTHVHHRIRNRTIDGTPIITKLGRPRALFSLPFLNIPESIRSSIWNNIITRETPVILIHPQDSLPYEVVLQSDQGTFTRLFDAGTGLYEIALDLEQLP